MKLNEMREHVAERKLMRYHTPHESGWRCTQCDWRLPVPRNVGYSAPNALTRVFRIHSCSNHQQDSSAGEKD